MRRPAIRDDLAMQAGYHSPQLDVDVRLNTNEAPEPPPPGFRAALEAELADLDWHRYPDRMAVDLRQKIADHHGVSIDQVFVANGSNEVLQTICMTYGGPGRTVVNFEPTYALHSHIPKITNTKVVTGKRGPGFALDLKEVARVLYEAKPTITFLCSPNNPTGMIETEETIRAVADLAPGLVVVDEAYGQFAPWSAIELVDDEAPLVVTRTYSKTWSMAAARLGYLIGPSWLVRELFDVVLPYHLDAVKQIAGRVALDFEDAMNERVALLVEERGRVSAALNDLPVEVWPSSANFILFRPTNLDSDEVWQRLVDASILVRNCANWAGLDGCLRLTLGTPAENTQFLDALTGIVSGDNQ